MAIYNLLSCSGFTSEAGGWVASAGCLKGRLGLVVLFFLIAMIRKWGGEEVGMEFNFLLGLVGGLLSYFLIITFTGNFKMAFGIGILLAIVGGYFGGQFFGGGGE